MANITFIAHNIYGVGGTVRTVLNLAAGFCEQHQVTIVSVYQRVNEPSFDIDKRIRIIPLVDGRPGAADRDTPEYFQPSRDVHREEELYSQYSILTDSRIREYLAQDNSDVLIGTRPSLNIMIAQLGLANSLKIAQEHMSYEQISQEVIEQIRECYANIDAVVTVTEYEADKFREALQLPADSVQSIPNSVPRGELSVSDQTEKLIIAAGRITEGKRFELLIHAFSRVVQDYPDWKIRVYGDGALRAELRFLVQRLGLANNVLFMGRTSAMDEEWIKGSIAVSTSDFESFGMTLIEAMNAGLSVISTDCPVGPREIITHGEDGILIETGNIDQLESALRFVIANPSERRRIAKNGQTTAAKYEPTGIAGQYLGLFNKLRPGIVGVSTSQIEVGRNVSILPAIDRIFVKHGKYNESIIEITLLKKLPFSNIVIKIQSKTKNAKKFIVRSVANNSENYVYSFTINAEDFNTDAIWDAEIYWMGVKLNQANLALDNKALVSKQMAPSLESFGHFIAFKSIKGSLRFRSWRRRLHAEVTNVFQTDEKIVVKILPIFPIENVKNSYFQRRGMKNSRIQCDMIYDGKHVEVEAPIQAFVDARLGMHEDWDLFVHETSGRVRVGMIMDDIFSKKHIINYPAWNIDDSSSKELHSGEKILIRPYISIRNDLSLNVISKFITYGN